MTLILQPFSWLYGTVVFFRSFNKVTEQLAVPVIVVGNLTVGGTGKTPCVIALVQFLKKKNLKVGVVSRGFGGKGSDEPIQVTQATEVMLCGDEPKEIFFATGSPVVVHRKRLKACEALLAAHQLDVIVSDDGLQHLALPKDITIVVMDHENPLGNGLLLPAGPLRELPSRLRKVDYVLFRSEKLEDEPHTFYTKPIQWVHLQSGTTLPIGQMSSGVAVSSIGRPERFWNQLRALGIDYTPCRFPDHYQMKPEDLAPFEGQTLLMTRKDAVKCQAFATENMWYLEVEAILPNNVIESVAKKIASFERLH